MKYHLKKINYKNLLREAFAVIGLIIKPDTNNCFPTAVVDSRFLLPAVYIQKVQILKYIFYLTFKC